MTDIESVFVIFSKHLASQAVFIGRTILGSCKNRNWAPRSFLTDADASVPAAAFVRRAGASGGSAEAPGTERRGCWSPRRNPRVWPDPVLPTPPGTGRGAAGRWQPLFYNNDLENVSTEKSNKAARCSRDSDPTKPNTRAPGRPLPALCLMHVRWRLWRLVRGAAGPCVWTCGWSQAPPCRPFGGPARQARDGGRPRSPL